MVLKGAEILLYPTAIGGEEDEFDSSDMWQRAMIGHSAQNQIPVIASNRIGTEEGIETCISEVELATIISSISN